MPRAGALVVAFTVLLPVVAAAQDLDQVPWGQALTAALKPALPFPPATDEGTPVGGGDDAVWTVRWPAADGRVVEVLANPLNDANRTRALEAEADIQRAAMSAQRSSQGDYERALSDFARTGRVTGELREITLRDDGVAGERYDAESQLTVQLDVARGRQTFPVGAALDPVEVPPMPGLSAVVRVQAHEYGDPLRYCAAQAWLWLGPSGTTSIERQSGEDAVISVEGAGAEAWVVVTLSGNAGLVDQVLRQAHWGVLRERVTP